MFRAVLVASTLLPLVVRAEGVLDGAAGAWAIGGGTACARSSYQLEVLPSGTGMTIRFRARSGRVNQERVDAQPGDGFTATTKASPDVPAGTRSEYTAGGPAVFVVRNLSSGRSFTLVRYPTAGARQALQQQAQPPIARTVPTVGPAPTFSDPVALVGWLVENSARGFNASDDTQNANVLSPGLRAALRASLQRARQRGEAPCGVDADIIRAVQDDVTLGNLRLAAEPTGPDRVRVTATYDLDGSWRSWQFLTVNLDGGWKVKSEGRGGRGELQPAPGAHMRAVIRGWECLSPAPP